MDRSGKYICIKDISAEAILSQNPMDLRIYHNHIDLSKTENRKGFINNGLVYWGEKGRCEKIHYLEYRLGLHFP